jgi:hypothetical protein
MTCVDCTCNKLPGEIEALTPLLEKLQKAKFSGDLILHFSGGEVESADLRHYLPISELKRHLPTIEDEPELN